MRSLHRIVITGGGTGGHFYPALSVAQEIRRRHPESEILFIGTSTGIEATGAPEAGFPIRHIHAAGFSSNPVKLLKFSSMNSLGLFQAMAILKKQKPDLVVGSGGFVSFPVLMAARVLGIPYVILEQNVLPGKVNRLMSRWALKVMASFEASKQYINSSRLIITGNPIRRVIVERTREEAFKTLNLSPDKFTLAITGASQGARSINNAIIAALPKWKEKDWQILHLVGRKNYQDVKNAVDPLVKEFNGEYRCIDYTEDIASVYAASDLVVSRSGASTLAEITARGLPSILIPYPYAADNHQEKNARWVEETGGAIVFLDNQVEAQLAQAVLDLAADTEKRRVMGEKSLTLGRPDALTRIVDEIEASVNLTGSKK